MNNFIAYIIHSTVMLAVLYSVYWLFLRKDTFFNVNRYYLLCTIILSLLIPLVDIRLFAGTRLSPVTILLDPVTITPEKVEKVVSAHLSWFEVAGVVYFTGMIIFLIRLIFQLAQVWIIVRRNKISRREGMNIVFVDRDYSPFSIFNLVFIRKEYLADGRLTPILAHEMVHIRQYHTLDLVLSEIAIIIQWFNPFAWFLGRSMKGIHEFLADQGVLREGFRKNEYQTLILNEAMGLQLNNLTNNFNISLIKNRIEMMKKSRSAAWAPVKALLAFPAFIAVLFLFSAGTVTSLSAQDKPAKEVKPVPGKTETVQEKKSEDVFTVVEKQPEYKGGQDAMIQFLATNIKYPEEAKKKGIQGKVFVTFVVEADGSVAGVQVLRGIGSGCDEEAIRVVKMMPRWTPGQMRGKNVRVQYNLPINFRLDTDEKK